MPAPLLAALPAAPTCSRCRTASATHWQILRAWRSTQPTAARTLFYLLLCDNCADFIARLRRVTTT